MSGQLPRQHYPTVPGFRVLRWLEKRLRIALITCRGESTDDMLDRLVVERVPAVRLQT